MILLMIAFSVVMRFANFKSIDQENMKIG